MGGLMVKQTGFTLVELMIVVAIIGILAAIAVSNYQVFVARSQATEAIVLLDGAKVNTEDEAIVKGQFPQTVNDLVAINTQVAGRYGAITGTSSTAINVATGKIIYKFSTAGVNNDLRNKSVWYIRSNDGVWSCETNLISKFAPKMCATNPVSPSGT
jgi:type IV pilus assembly protein PilA